MELNSASDFEHLLVVDFLFLFCICVGEGRGSRLCTRAWVLGQRTVYENWFSPFTVYVLVIELKHLYPVSYLADSLWETVSHYDPPASASCVLGR